MYHRFKLKVRKFQKDWRTTAGTANEQIIGGLNQPPSQGRVKERLRLVKQIVQMRFSNDATVT